MQDLKMLKLIAIISSVWVLAACSSSSTDAPPPQENDSIDWQAAADSSSNALIDLYWNYQHNYFNYGNMGNTEFQYWPQAHALDVLIDAYLRTGDSYYVQYMYNWFEGVHYQNGETFQNMFYDDMQWNALAMLRAYHATGDEKFLQASIKVWGYILTGWTDLLDGGIMWAEFTPHSKNACSNAPASILAARLYEATGEEEYLDWAIKIYEWQKNHLIDHANGAVWDSIAMENNSVVINKDWIFTYNQGTYVGAAVELYEITGHSVYLNDAVKSADYTLHSLTQPNSQLLVDEGGGDGGLFKGIFIRYFTQLILLEDLPANTRTRYLRFLEHNAERLWTEGTDKSRVLFDSFWGNKPAPNEEIDLTIQESGAMLIEAAALLQNEGFLN